MRGITETLLCRILMLNWSSWALSTAGIQLEAGRVLLQAAATPEDEARAQEVLVLMRILSVGSLQVVCCILLTGQFRIIPNPELRPVLVDFQR